MQRRLSHRRLRYRLPLALGHVRFYFLLEITANMKKNQLWSQVSPDSAVQPREEAQLRLGAGEHLGEEFQSDRSSCSSLRERMGLAERGAAWLRGRFCLLWGWGCILGTCATQMVCLKNGDK